MFVYLIYLLSYFYLSGGLLFQVGSIAEEELIRFCGRSIFLHRSWTIFTLSTMGENLKPEIEICLCGKHLVTVR